MPSWLRSLLVCLAIMGAATIGSNLLAMLGRRHLGLAIAIVCIGIPSALAWRVWWGVKNPTGGDTDHW